MVERPPSGVQPYQSLNCGSSLQIHFCMNIPSIFTSFLHIKMGLVGYSDSEGSDTEEVKTTSKPTPAAKATAKPSFQKLVDKANPGKIRVGLPTSAEANGQRDGDDIDTPPAKRAKTGGGFGGFNAMLPAPKKAAQPVASSSNTSRRGLGVGINLKTSGQAAFSREPVEPSAEYDEYGSASGIGHEEGGRAVAAVPEPKEPEIKLIGKRTVFKPLSVANKQGKKKKTVAELSSANRTAATSVPSKPPTEAVKPAAVPAKPRVSFFSLDQKDDQSVSQAPDPTEDDLDERAEDEPVDDSWPGTSGQPIDTPASDSDINQVTDVASSLNLTAAERRQLFGRHSKGDNLSAINIVNFNTDEEYARNEAMRASGEAEAAAQQKIGVRAIAPGKHSLKQLVSAATTQKDALEDSFAQGRRNKKEAGNKYGW